MGLGLDNPSVAEILPCRTRSKHNGALVTDDDSYLCLWVRLTLCALLVNSFAMVGANQLLPQRTRCPQALASRRRCLNLINAVLPDHVSDGPSASGRAADSAEPWPASPLSQTQIDHLGKASKVLAATVVVYHLAFSSSTARAEDRPWKPRRHYRRIGERFTDTWAEELVEVG